MQLIFFLVLFSLNLLADENCSLTEGALPKGLEELSVPNCLESQYRKTAQRGNLKKFCKCKDKYEANYGEKISFNPLSKDEVRKRAFDALILEYKKNMTSQLVELAKIRTLPDSPDGLPLSQKACSLKSVADLSQGCGAKSVPGLLKSSDVFKSLSADLAQEMAAILSKDPSLNAKGILNRDRKQNQCGVSESAP